MIDFKEIIKRPTEIDKNHESLFRSYGILQEVVKMLERGDSNETILSVINYLSYPQLSCKLSTSDIEKVVDDIVKTEI